MTRPPHIAPAPFAETHRHPRCITPTPPAGNAVVDDTAVIAELRRQLAEVTVDRDGLLFAISRITVAAGLPDGYEIDKVIQAIEATVAAGKETT